MLTLGLRFFPVLALVEPGRSPVTGCRFSFSVPVVNALL